MNNEQTLTLPPVPTIPSLEKIEELRTVSPALDFATALVISDESSSLGAQTFVQKCNDHISRVESFFEDGKKASDKLHKWFTTAVASLTKTARDAKAIVGGKVYEYQRAEQRRIANEQAVAREKARKEAEEAAIKEAEDLQSIGATAEADRVLAKDIVVAAPTFVPPAAVAGSSIRENWQWRGEDLMTTVKAVAAGTISIDALNWNGTWITQRVKAMKADSKIPGVRVWDQGTFVAGKTA